MISPGRHRVLAAAVATALAPAWLPAAPPTSQPKLDLAAEARTLAAKWSSRLGPGYSTRIDARRHIVYVSAIDPKALTTVAALLAAVHDAQRDGLFPLPLQRNVTVILPTVDDYRTLVPRAKAQGAYTPARRTLVSITYGSTLVHEFIHALHHNDQAAVGRRHAIWVVEGLAMLYQQSRLRGRTLEVLDRGVPAELRAALADGSAHTLADLCAMTPKTFGADADLCYRQAHQVMLYLHQRGKLKAFYAAHRTGAARDVDGTRALSAVLGKPIKQIDADWRKWLADRKTAWKPRTPRAAHLGIRMARSAGGVRVAGFLPGSAAHSTALLSAGDVITHLAGRPVRSPRDLTAAVQSCRPGQIIDIRILRDGAAMTIKHRLGVAPR